MHGMLEREGGPSTWLGPNGKEQLSQKPTWFLNYLTHTLILLLEVDWEEIDANGPMIVWDGNSCFGNDQQKVRRVELLVLWDHGILFKRGTQTISIHEPCLFVSFMTKFETTWNLHANRTFNYLLTWQDYLHELICFLIAS